MSSYKYEEMPGKDQFALFVASLEGMNIGKRLLSYRWIGSSSMVSVCWHITQV